MTYAKLWKYFDSQTGTQSIKQAGGSIEFLDLDGFDQLPHRLNFTPVNLDFPGSYSIDQSHF